MKARILLVDDEPALRELFRELLTRAGYEVSVAAHGREAMTLLACARFDLVITDIVMPEQEGIETILKIRRQQPLMPIIAMSGGGRVGPEEYLRIAQTSGATRLLTKPFPPGRLLEMVSELLATPGNP